MYFCELKEEERLYKIGMFSKMNHVTIKALRHYDEIGLLKPIYTDEENGYRYYSSRQLPIIHQILALREAGFSLEEIKAVQNGMPEKELLKRKKIEIMKKIAEETLRLSKVESYLTRDTMNQGYHIVIKELPEVKVASMRLVMPSYDSLFTILPPMGAEMERLGCACAEPEYCFNIYHDGEYKETDVDVEVCEAIVELKKDSDKLKFKTISKVETAACVLHKGAYKDFPKAYRAVLCFAEENGYEIIDNPREWYIDGVWNRDTEEEWLTEIQFPVRKVSG